MCANCGWYHGRQAIDVELTAARPMGLLPIAVDAMGGDQAPGEIVAGAMQAADELGVAVVLVGRPDEIGDTGGLEVIAASEVIAMDDDPAQGVRRKKDSSLVRAAEAVRDGRASAMVSAGNTGATMASALLRMGRIKGVARPAIATPIPVPGWHADRAARRRRQRRVQPPSGWCSSPRWARCYARDRFGIASPRVGLLSIGEEASKGNPLVKETHALLADGPDRAGGDFIGNVEGRDLMTDARRRGRHRRVHRQRRAQDPRRRHARRWSARVFEAFGTDEATRAAAEVLLPALLPLYADSSTPTRTAGAMLLGRRRRLHHQPRLVVGHAPSSTPSGSAREMVAGDVGRPAAGGDRRSTGRGGPADLGPGCR